MPRPQGEGGPGGDPPRPPAPGGAGAGGRGRGGWPGQGALRLTSSCPLCLGWAGLPSFWEEKPEEEPVRGVSAPGWSEVCQGGESGESDAAVGTPPGRSGSPPPVLCLGWAPFWEEKPEKEPVRGWCLKSAVRAK